MEEGFKPPVTQTQEVAKPAEIPLVDVMARTEASSPKNFWIDKHSIIWANLFMINF